MMSISSLCEVNIIDPSTVAVGDAGRSSRYTRRLRCIRDWSTNTSSTTSAQWARTDTSRSSWNKSPEASPVLLLCRALSFRWWQKSGGKV